MADYGDMLQRYGLTTVQMPHITHLYMFKVKYISTESTVNPQMWPDVRTVEVDGCTSRLGLDWFQDYRVRPTSFILRNFKDRDSLDHWSQVLRTQRHHPITSLHMDGYGLQDGVLLQVLRYPAWLDRLCITVSEHHNVAFQQFSHVTLVPKVTFNIQQTYSPDQQQDLVYELKKAFRHEVGRIKGLHTFTITMKERWSLETRKTLTWCKCVHENDYCEQEEEWCSFSSTPQSRVRIIGNSIQIKCR
jgi:hypothetical protein